MIRVTALTLLLCACGLSQDNFKKRFEALDDKRDHDGVVALWKGAPGRVLGTIDSYLEGALKLMEEGKADDKTIATMHQRALRGALAADQAFDRAIYTDYAAWPALTKLHYVDDLMHELGDQAPRVRTRAHIDPLRSEQGTLRDYYRKKQARYSLHLPGTFDDHLRSVFPSDARGRESAASFLRRRRADIRRRVAHVTGRETYLVDQVLDELLPRCRILGLARPQLEQRAFVDACILVTTLAVSFVKGQRPRYAR